MDPRDRPEDDEGEQGRRHADPSHHHFAAIAAAAPATATTPTRRAFLIPLPLVEGVQGVGVASGSELA